jgi:hypothetical protein
MARIESRPGRARLKLQPQKKDLYNSFIWQAIVSRPLFLQWALFCLRREDKLFYASAKVFALLFMGSYACSGRGFEDGLMKNTYSAQYFTLEIRMF